MGVLRPIHHKYLPQHPGTPWHTLAHLIHAPAATFRGGRTLEPPEEFASMDFVVQDSGLRFAGSKSAPR
jgi:hypothetical protein